MYNFQLSSQGIIKIIDRSKVKTLVNRDKYACGRTLLNKSAKMLKKRQDILFWRKVNK